MASSVTVDLGISKYKKSYEFKTDWYHQRPDSGYFRSLKLSDDELEEDMQDEIDSVMGLLDRLKEERKQELMSSQTDKLSRLEKLKRSRLKETSCVDTECGDKHTTRMETQVSGSRHSPDEPIDVKIRLNRGNSRDEEEDDLEEGYREGQQKRKQDTIIAELREKAQIISKSARKGPEDVANALSRTHDIEGDPEAAQYLRKIRHADALEESEDKENKAENKVERSVVTMDFPSPTSPRKTSVTVKLNLDIQKSKIAVARGSGLQGRRKPTTEHIRRSLRLSDEEEPEDGLAAGYEAEHEDMDADVSAAISPVEASPLESATPSAEDPLLVGELIEAKVMPMSPVEYGQKINLERRGSFEGLIPRSTPKERKPAWKSKTYGGVALPAFAEAMKAGSKSLKKTDTAEKLLTADIVKQAALNKLNKAAKEEKQEKEPEKPDWLVEAESRRKLHDRRRQAVKQKPPEPKDPGIPFRLKATGSKIFENDTEDPITTEPLEDSEKNKFVVKLKHVNKTGEKPTLEPEEAKISFKLKSTGIQLIKPEETRQEPAASTSVQRQEPALSTRIQLQEPEPRNIKQEPERPIIQRELPISKAEVKYFEMIPTKDMGVSKAEEPAMTMRLRHVPERSTPDRKMSEPRDESELARKLRRRVKALPINPDEEDKIESQEYRTLSTTQTFQSYVTPQPVKTTNTPSDYTAVQLEGKYLKKAKIVIPPATRTKAESTPPMSPTQTHAKPFYKVTPLSSDPPRHIRERNEFILPTSRRYESPVPQPSSSSRAFSSPPMSPTSKVTVVSPHVDTPPITNRAAVSYKPFKGRRMSGERAKTVTVQAGDIPRIIPGRRSSSGEHPLKATVRRSSSLEYPKSHVQAPDANLKHAVTVIKESQVPQKAKTVMMTDRPLDYPYKGEHPGQVLPSWKQDLMERHRTHRYVARDSDTPDQSMSPGSSSDKENEPRIVTQLEPLWMRELAEKRRNIYNRTQSNGDIQFERIEAFERFEKPARSEDSDEEVREKPSFMKEFERKRRLKGRGPQRLEHGYPISNSSYV